MHSVSEPDISQSCDIVEPQDRLKHLINYCNSVEVDFHIPPTRYYRSGLEMVRMANVYYNEGNLENAYVLYLKFMTLFLEKIRKHPDFHSVPVKIKAVNQAKLREVLPKAEKLKQQLLNQYKEEYNRYIAERKRKKNEPRPMNSFAAGMPSSSTVIGTPAPIQMPIDFDAISYPDPEIVEEAKNDGAKRPSAPPAQPVFDRSKKPSDLFNPENSGHLRPVIVPSKVMVQFQSMAQRNTINNIETCGILAGKLAKNELIITHMILPKQKGTSDSCTTMNEEELFDFQDQHNLITIGWIHTHPTQTAFLSSVDLHTHCPYQLLMPEAIAIVCAPRYNETGFFVLTPDYGLKFIANCRKSGFHPHPTEPPLFMVAQHVTIDQNADLEVLDLRS